MHTNTTTMTEEEKAKKAEQIKEALEMMKEAHGLYAKAVKLIQTKVRGVRVISPDDLYRFGDNKMHIHLHDGIKKLAGILGVKTYHPLDWDEEPKKDELDFDYDGAVFFQLGSSTKTNYRFT